MSRLDELIAELCPDGVEYKSLKEIASILRGKRLTKSELSPDALYPVYHGGLEPLGYYLKSNRPANTVMIINVGASAGTVGFCDKRFWSSDGCYCISHVDRINQKFIYYALSMKEKILMSKVRYAGIPTLDVKVVENIIIPVPPLPVQEEIVRILDTFSELTAELTAELSKRKQQYQYYRNTLVDFKDGLDRPFKINKLIADLCPNGVEYKTLGELATDIFRGSGITRDQVRKSGTPCVRYGEIYTTYGVWFEECVSFTDESIIPSKKYFEYGDILFAITGEKVEDIAKSCVYIGKEKCLIGGDIVVMKHTQNPKYMGYALSTSSAQAQKSKGKVKSKVVHSSIPSIKEIVIPVPPLPIQKEIVAILDRFDALCNDLTSGLPAEIEARKKQYEYYRDKLLTFKEAV